MGGRTDGRVGGWVVHEVFVLLGVTAALVAILAAVAVGARAPPPSHPRGYVLVAVCVRWCGVCVYVGTYGVVGGGGCACVCTA